MNINDMDMAASDSKMRLRAWLKILKASNLIEKQIRERLRAEFATTLPRFDVMSALARSNAGLKMSELSGTLKVSNGNITGIVDRLVKDGHVVRVAVQGDRRAQLVRLTRKGRSQFNQHAKAHERWVDEILGKLSARDTDVLIGLLAEIAEDGEDA